MLHRGIVENLIECRGLANQHGAPLRATRWARARRSPARMAQILAYLAAVATTAWAARTALARRPAVKV